MKLRLRLLLVFSVLLTVVVAFGGLNVIGLYHLKRDLQAGIDNIRRPLDLPRSQAFKSSDGEGSEPVRGILEAERFDRVLQAIRAADEVLKRDLRLQALQIGLMAIIALTIFTWMAYALQTHVFQRLQQVYEFAKTSIQGLGNRRLLLSGHDELSLMAARLNEAIDLAESREQRLRGQMRELRQSLFAALGCLDSKIAVFSVNGLLIVSNMERDSELRLGAKLMTYLQQDWQEKSIELDDRTYLLRRHHLQAPGPSLITAQLQPTSVSDS